MSAAPAGAAGAAGRAGAHPDFDALAAEAAGWLGEYLRVRTVNPPGNETEGARWLQALLAREGIASEIFESAPGRGNLYARVRGTGRKGALILLSHIDVVPATAERWRVDPWSGTVRDGYVWGRGALDMKGVAVMELAAFVALKRRGVPLARDLVLIANADEESDSSGAEWFTREKAGLIRDAELLLNEGGSNRVGDDGRVIYYGVAVTEKRPFWLRVDAYGSPGHGSMPTRDNAAARLARALGRLAAWEPPATVTPPAARFFADLATREPDPRRRAWLADVEAAIRDPAAAEFLSSHRYYNAVLRNTVTLTGLRGSEKTNIIPPEASAELDVRLLPGVEPDRFLAELRAVLDDPGLVITPISPAREVTSAPLDGPVPDAVRAVVAELDPGALVTTPMLAGYTDSGYYRALGIAAYGISPFRLTEADTRGVHGNDERVSLENIRFGVEFVYRIVERVARE